MIICSPPVSAYSNNVSRFTNHDTWQIMCSSIDPCTKMFHTLPTVIHRGSCARRPSVPTQTIFHASPTMIHGRSSAHRSTPAQKYVTPCQTRSVSAHCLLHIGLSFNTSSEHCLLTNDDRTLVCQYGDISAPYKYRSKSPEVITCL